MCPGSKGSIMTTQTDDLSTGWSVRKVTEAELPALTLTLAAAFFDDPFFRWWIPEDTRRAEILPAFFRLVAEVNLSHDELYGAEDVAAGAIWIPPGRQPTEDEMAELAPAIAHATDEYAERLFQVLDLMSRAHPSEPHWYLFFLATRPEWQSRGLGSGVLRAVLDNCDRDGTPAYLEATSEGNKRLYLRHGFVVTGEISVTDAPPLFCMWRAPR
jgi:ribosomal protein S18 acetylase RimI-like enzyme